MEKVLMLSGKEVRFKSSALLPVYYANAFNSDVLLDTLNIGDDKAKNTNLMYRMMWAMAYCADTTIKPLEQWFDDVFKGEPLTKVYTIFPELNEMFWNTTKGVTEKN